MLSQSAQRKVHTSLLSEVRCASAQQGTRWTTDAQSTGFRFLFHRKSQTATIPRPFFPFSTDDPEKVNVTAHELADEREHQRCCTDAMR